MKVIFSETEREALDDEQLAKLDEDGAIEVESLGDLSSDFEDVAGLKRALGEERATRKKFEKDFKATRARLTIAEEEKSEGAIAEKDAEIESLKLTIKERDTEIGDLKTSIREKDLNARITDAVTKAKGDLELLRPHLKMKLDEDPGLDLDTIMPDLIEKHPGAFKATDHSGGGSGLTGGGGMRTGEILGLPKRRSKMSEREKVDYQKEHGLDKFMELPA